MSNTIDPLDEYFAAAGVTDPEALAYLKRYPDVAAAVATYGPDTAQIHWQNFGQKEGRTWGAAAPVVAAVPTTPVATPANTALPASYGTDQNSWDAYMQSARQSTEGMNQMPFVYSDYGNVPIDDKSAMSMFYPQGSVTGAAQSNPLLAGIASAAQPAQLQKGAANPLLGTGPFRYEEPTMEQRIAAQYGTRS